MSLAPHCPSFQGFGEGLAAIPLGQTYPWLCVPKGTPPCSPGPADLQHSRVSYLSVCNAGVCKNKERSKRTFWGEAGGLRVAKKSTCKRQKLMFP